MTDAQFEKPRTTQCDKVVYLFESARDAGSRVQTAIAQPIKQKVAPVPVLTGLALIYGVILIDVWQRFLT